MSLHLPMTFMSVAMDRPLNQAHKHERIAHAHMNKGQWDEAEQSFILASKLMKKAMEGMTNSDVIEPLQLQANKLEKMKDVIDIKRKESKSYHASSKDCTRNVQYDYPESNLGYGDDIVKKELEHEMSTQTSKRDKSESTKENGKWQFVPHDIQQLIEEREHDSLLQFLNLPVELSGNEEVEQSTTSSCKKIPKSQSSIIEEYKVRIELLRNTALGIWGALEESEKENKILQSTVDQLRSMVLDLKDKIDALQEDAIAPSPYFGHEEDDSVKPQLGYLSDKGCTDPMIASIIVQPESFFEFEEQGEVSLRLQPVANESKGLPLNEGKEHANHPSRMKIAGSSNKQGRQHGFRQVKHNPRHQLSSAVDYLENSIKYEELDDECNNESDAISQSLSEVNLASANRSHHMQFDIAGLPPLSPVHFEPDDLVMDPPGGDLSGKQS